MGGYLSLKPLGLSNTEPCRKLPDCSGGAKSFDCVVVYHSDSQILYVDGLKQKLPSRLRNRCKTFSQSPLLRRQIRRLSHHHCSYADISGNLSLRVSTKWPKTHSDSIGL